MSDHDPIPAMRLLGDIPTLNARMRPDAIALSFEGRETSYGEFERHSNRVAHGLRAAGVGKGDRVCYFGKNSAAYFELLFGAAKIGAVTCPVGFRLAPPEVAYVVGDAGAKIIFVGGEFAETFQATAADLPNLETILQVEPSGADLPAFEDWRDRQSDAPVDSVVREDEPVLQLYTSGTTGRPKGAILSHRNILGRTRVDDEDMAWNRWDASDISLVASPVAHIAGTRWGIVTLLNGAKAIIAREFDPLRVLEFIEKDRISKLFLVPSAMQIVIRQPRARSVDYSRLKYLLYGTSPIAPDLLAECMEVFGCGFAQQYGLTETTGAVAFLPPSDHRPDSPRLLSAGRALPDAEIRIVDKQGQTVPAGEIGEVAVKSVGNMVGYWNLPEATAETLSADGWLRTGDAAYMDEDGYIFIQDRIRDMIISGGENIYPAEVEASLYGCPGIAEVAVIGVPDAKWGEAVKAVVVPRAGCDLSAEAVMDFARGRIAGFKIPKTVEFVDELPRNASGKVLRRRLRERFWGDAARQVN